MRILYSFQNSLLSKIGQQARQNNDPADRLGLFGLLLFALTAAPYPNLAGVGLFLLLVAFFISKQRVAHWGEPIVVLMAGLFLYLLMSILIGWQLSPHYLKEHFSHAFYILSLPLFSLLVAWGLKAQIPRVHLVLFAALCGYIAAVTLPLITGEVGWGIFLQGQRDSMLFSNPIRLGLYSTAVLLGLLTWIPDRRIDNPRSMIVFGLYLLLIILTTQALIVSQARASWTAAAVVIPAVLLTRLLLHPREQPSRSSYNSALFTVGLMLVGVVVYLNHATIERRWSQESATIKAAIKGEAVEFDSFGIRVHMWHLGLEKITERPWLGHGPGSVPEYLSHAPKPLSDYRHMHNMAIDLLVRTGIIGLLLVATIFLLLFYALLHAWRKGIMDKNLLLFTTGALLLFLIDGLTGYPLSRTQGRFFIALIGGLAYTGFLYRQHSMPGNT